MLTVCSDTLLTSEYIDVYFRELPKLSKLRIDCRFINGGEQICLAEVLKPLLSDQITDLTLPVSEVLKQSLPNQIDQQDALIKVLLPFQNSIKRWILCANPYYRTLDYGLCQKLEVLWDSKTIFK